MEICRCSHHQSIFQYLQKEDMLLKQQVHVVHEK